MQKKEAPEWFYISSIFIAFLFSAVISIFATLHFDDIGNLNLFVVFTFVAMVSFFLISAVYFISEKMKWHPITPLLFFIGVVSLMVYAFKAVDASDLVRYSIVYTIVVSAISIYVLAINKDGVKFLSTKENGKEEKKKSLAKGV